MPLQRPAARWLTRVAPRRAAKRAAGFSVCRDSARPITANYRGSFIFLSSGNKIPRTIAIVAGNFPSLRRAGLRGPKLHAGGNVPRQSRAARERGNLHGVLLSKLERRRALSSMQNAPICRKPRCRIGTADECFHVPRTMAIETLSSAGFRFRAIPRSD